MILSGVLLNCISLGKFTSLPAMYISMMTPTLYNQTCFFVSNNNTSRIDQRAFYGAPDFIAEILSEGTIERDRIIKKALYERFGVQEYWIIDPESKQCEGFFLVDRMYQSLPSSAGTVASRLFQTDFNF
jgi:Uma2 family endonuclease